MQRETRRAQTARSHGRTAARTERRAGRTATTERRAGRTATTQRRAGRTATTQRRAATSVTSQRGTQREARRQATRVSVSSQQRTRIRQVVVSRHLVSRLRVRHVNFAVRVGVVVPRTIRLFVVPQEIMVIVPRFRHFRCFIFDGELIIVDPVTFVIVAVIPI